MSTMNVTPKDLKPLFERRWLVYDLPDQPSRPRQAQPPPTKRRGRRLKKKRQKPIYLTREQEAELVRLRIPKGIYRKRVKLTRYQASLLKEAEARESRKRERSRAIVMG